VWRKSSGCVVGHGVWRSSLDGGVAHRGVAELIRGWRSSSGGCVAHHGLASSSGCGVIRGA
jgi:hypothetical protein